MYISAEEPNFAFRSASSDKGNLVIASGESHKPGQEPNTIQRYYNIEDHTRKTFTVRSIPYMWSTQDTVTIDKVPYIGKITSDSKNIYVATGFGEWGMTTGTLSGMLLSDLILKKENRWESLFDPARFKSGSGLKELIKQNINVAGELIKGKLPKETSSPGLFAANEARVVKVGANTIAAYHDKDGKVYALDPVCTHMGCTVAWNNAEKSWDCPCHGSRFSYTGEVLHGPTVKDLPKKESQENISALKTLFKHLKR
jgi:nitrite reductase/ring-hydroxylating ferredoxin subunit